MLADCLEYKCRNVILHHAELWLQLDLQPLQRALQICGFRFAGMERFCAGGDFFVQFLALEKKTFMAVFNKTSLKL